MNDYPKECPHCKKRLDRGDIYEVLLEQYGDPVAALEAAEAYGWTETSRKRFSQLVARVNIERDMIEYYECPYCWRKVEL